MFVWWTRSELCLSNLLSPLLEPSNKEPNLRHALQQTQWDPWTRLDVKSKLFRDFGEQLYDRRAVKSAHLAALEYFIRAPNRRCCLIGCRLTLLFCSNARFFKQAWGKSLWLSRQCDRVQAKKTFFVFWLDLSFSPIPEQILIWVEQSLLWVLTGRGCQIWGLIFLIFRANWGVSLYWIDLRSWKLASGTERELAGFVNAPRLLIHLEHFSTSVGRLSDERESHKNKQINFKNKNGSTGPCCIFRPCKLENASLNGFRFWISLKWSFQPWDLVKSSTQYDGRH